MLAVSHHNHPASLMDIRDYLLEKTGKDWAIASLYISLDRLKKRGCVESFKGEPKNIRGGKALRYYRLTDRGIQALKETWRMQESMWLDFIASVAEARPD